MVIKVYTSGISGNKEVKKRQQRIMMILESKGIKYEEIDITEPGNAEDKQFMQEHAEAKGSRNPLPPQIFNETDYCGDYEGFDIANENDVLEEFLKLPITRVNGKEKEPIVSEKESNHLDSSIRIEDAIDSLVPETNVENNIDHKSDLNQGPMEDEEEVVVEEEVEVEEEEEEEVENEPDSSMKDVAESEVNAEMEVGNGEE